MFVLLFQHMSLILTTYMRKNSNCILIFCWSTGVWSPGQTRKLERRSSDVEEKKADFVDSGSSTPAVWSPRSAPSSPTLERKTYKPVKFESPVLSRKNKTPKSRVSTDKIYEFRIMKVNNMIKVKLLFESP